MTFGQSLSITTNSIRQSEFEAVKGNSCYRRQPGSAGNLQDFAFALIADEFWPFGKYLDSYAKLKSN